jgi:hypothetical protein
MISASGRAVPERVLALQRRDGLHGVGAADGLCAGLRQAEVLDLALLDQILHRSGDVLDGHFGIDAVLIEEIDDIDPQALERGLGNLLDVLRPAVQPLPGPRLPSGLISKPNLVAMTTFPRKGSRPRPEFFVVERAVDLGRVEEGDAALDGRAEQRDRILLLRETAVGKGHSHAAEAERRYFQIAFSQFALLHLRFCIVSPSYVFRVALGAGSPVTRI